MYSSTYLSLPVWLPAQARTWYLLAVALSARSAVTFAATFSVAVDVPKFSSQIDGSTPTDVRPLTPWSLCDRALYRISLTVVDHIRSKVMEIRFVIALGYFTRQEMVFMEDL